jgi:hypothetical protein
VLVLAPEQRRSLASTQADIPQTKQRGHKDGVPDIGLVIKGRFYAVECKSSTGRQSEGQKRFESGLVKADGQYLVVRGVEDLERLFRVI